MKKGICKHYSSNIFFGNKCAAGVSVRDKVTGGGHKPEWIKGCPCHKANTPVFICDLYEDHTDQEIAEHEKWIDEAVNHITIVIPLIAKLKKQHGDDGGSGKVDCPVCSKELGYTISSHNQHIHMHCSTDGCISFME